MICKYFLSFCGFSFLFFVLPVYCYQPISLHPRAHMLIHVIPWTSARQTPLSMDFSRQEYWSGLPFPSPGFSFLNGVIWSTSVLFWWCPAYCFHYFCFWCHKKPLPDLWYWRFVSRLLSESFVILALIFRSLIQFYFSFAYSMRLGSNSILYESSSFVPVLSAHFCPPLTLKEPNYRNEITR